MGLSCPVHFILVQLDLSSNLLSSIWNIDVTWHVIWHDMTFQKAQPSDAFLLWQASSISLCILPLVLDSGSIMWHFPIGTITFRNKWKSPKPLNPKNTLASWTIHLLELYLNCMDGSWYLNHDFHHIKETSISLLMSRHDHLSKFAVAAMHASDQTNSPQMATDIGNGFGFPSKQL